jgi:hypothetical protein
MGQRRTAPLLKITGGLARGGFGDYKEKKFIRDRRSL